MKKSVPIIIAVLVIVGGAGVYLGFIKDNNDSTSNSSASNTEPAKTDTFTGGKRACDVVTLEDAKRVLGEAAEAGGSNADAPTDGQDVVVSNCTYSDGAATVAQGKSVSILARSPKSSSGAEDNKSQFGAQKPAEAEDVTGYGEAAYWNPAFGQLNILKDGTWYIISNGPIRVDERTLDQAKQLADLVSSKF